MQIKNFIVVLLFVQLLFNCQGNKPEVATVELIPKPNSQVINAGYFELNSTVGIDHPDKLKVSAEFLKAFIEQSKTIRLSKGNDIQFTIDESINNDEGYSLNISTDKIEIKAKTDQGAFYAVQTLRQLFPVGFESGTFNEEKVGIQTLSIRDAPRFGHRGMHLDVARHMFSIDFIKKYIDALAMLKMNTFHWHLTDDQGWRIEIKKYPKLNSVSAFRNETLIGHYNDQPQKFDGETYGGVYTQDEIKDVVAYAQKRFITVIPEIEMPGHAQAVISAYPALGCTEENIEVATTWGVFETIFCTKEDTFSFLEGVLEEVLELFPSKYIHIGGDEAPKTRWKNCSNCQAKIKAEGLKDEHELQSYFITRIENYVNSKGRQIIGWDEILEGGLAPNATVMSWRGTQGAIDAVKSGNNVIMTPTSHCYFDYYQSDNTDEPIAIGGFLPLEKVYSFNPIPEGLTEAESKYITGAQGNIWTEYIKTSDHVEYMAFPRILALSEVVWSTPEGRDYKEFVPRVENFYKRLDALDIKYANHLYEVEGTMIFRDKQSFYELKTLNKDSKIYFTTNGSPANLFSKIYEAPILINETTNLKFSVYNAQDEFIKTYNQTINYHKAVGAKITIDKQPSKAYSGSGAEGLINGISGSETRYGDKEWLGFSGEDIEITIDLGEEAEINSVKTRFHNGNGQWIYAPKEIQLSIDGADFETFAIPVSESLLVDKTINPDKKGQLIRLRIPNYGIIPEGKEGSGNKAWTFIDEIVVD